MVDPFTVPPWERPITAPPRLPDFTRATPLPGRKKRFAQGDFKNLDCKRGQVWSNILQRCVDIIFSGDDYDDSSSSSTTPRYLPTFSTAPAASTRCGDGGFWNIIQNRCVPRAIIQHYRDDFYDSV